MSKRLLRNLYHASVACGLLGISTIAVASAFQLFEQNVSGLGNFWAGAAAIADDASTAYYNPAGLVMIPDKQLVSAGTAILGNLETKGNSNWSLSNPFYNPLLPSSGPKFFSYSQSGRADGGTDSFVPAFYFASPLTDRVFFGLAVESPFGLDSDYADDAFSRYSATDSSIQTIEINQDLAFKLTDKLSLGVGVDAMYASANLNSVEGLPGLPTLPPSNWNPVGSKYDSSLTNEGHDWGYGWNAGILYQFSSRTRIGLSYRSPITVDLQGESKLQVPTVPPLVGGAITTENLQAELTFPSTTMLSIYQVVTQQLALMGTVNYTTWDEIKNITLENVAGSGSTGTNGSVTLSQNFRNTWRFALGANYLVNSQWTLKAGAGYDETPVNNHDETIRLPGANNFALAVGTHYQFAKNLGLDIGYAHLFFEQSKINSNMSSLANATINVNAKATSSANVIGAQMTWDLG